MYEYVNLCVCVQVRYNQKTAMDRVKKQRDCVGAEKALTPKEHTQSKA